MSDRSPEIDCNCDRRAAAGRDERGDYERCIDCGRKYLVTNDDLVFVEE
ncbi:MAG: hypothetical protein HOO67_06365 [Candidatus Peribacteraceae bacterium]|nr:hypothetical protein [Candidatus Peribacteraceae bacterium]